MVFEAAGQETYADMATPTGNALERRLPELAELEQLIARGGDRLRSRVLTRVTLADRVLPVHLVELGSRAPDAPALGLIGGIHGVERIGSQVILAYLQTLLERLDWDAGLQAQLAEIRLFMVPIANPTGMWNNSRCNANGVDLMRNAPVEARDRGPWLVRGQRLSRHLPWYRGRVDAPMEPELAALARYIREQILPRPLAITLDCHSGFGLRDRLWFPYAGRFEPIDDLAALYRLYRLFSRSYSNHRFYLMEPQANSYTAHGDLWDLLYDEARVSHPGHHFLPLTLELGSWLWVKKNPRQLLRFANLFNPIVPHRHARILRRHLVLLEFLAAATRSHGAWLPAPEALERLDTQAALRHWFTPGRRRG